MRQNEHRYLFNRIFDPSTKQVEVFDGVSRFIKAAINGENVCLFAYGQTGAGKTYTMEGPPNCVENLILTHTQTLNEQAGILPRTAILIEDEIRRKQSKDIEFSTEISSLEIYCENIIDLFNNQPEISFTQSKKMAAV